MKSIYMYSEMIPYHFTVDWYDFYRIDIFHDITAKNKIKRSSNSKKLSSSYQAVRGYTWMICKLAHPTFAVGPIPNIGFANLQLRLYRYSRVILSYFLCNVNTLTKVHNLCTEMWNLVFVVWENLGTLTHALTLRWAYVVTNTTFRSGVDVYDVPYKEMVSTSLRAFDQILSLVLYI